MSSPISFQAIRIFEEDGKFEQRIVERSTEDLPEGEVLIQVHYSSLNYKDALSDRLRYNGTPTSIDASNCCSFLELIRRGFGHYQLRFRQHGRFRIKGPAAWSCPS